MELKVIAKAQTQFPSKFGIPRQSGVVKSLTAKIVFEPEYRKNEAVRGLERFSHIWLLWGFSANKVENNCLTVRPPRLGGNKRLGVFATRSPYRPNPIGLSSVKLEKIEIDEKYGPVLYITGADILDGTPIYDIKPYLSYTDCHSEALGSVTPGDYKGLDVVFPDELIEKVPFHLREALFDILENDPRPAYHDEPVRVYGFLFDEYEIKFKVDKNIITVTDINKKD